MIAQRRRQAEVMDQPGLDAERHRRALNGLRRINALSRSSAILWSAIRTHARQLAPEPVRILDVASGGGDVAVALARRAQREGMTVHIAGCDVSPLAVEYARQQAERAGTSNVSFFQRDVLNEPLPDGYHVVGCSLFLHHLSDTEAEQLLRHMAAAAERLVLVNDLCRTRIGYVLAWIGCRLLTRSDVVHIDGPRSVAAAFTPAELCTLAERSGLSGATLSRHWPQRMLLTWRRP
jgi:2-polyprenyl-3-methyl-5-hydroxy-6-metoxy-1,4-benzoquinol methylase